MPADKIFVVTCRACDQAIKNGLCAYKCSEDGTYAEHRAADKIEVRVYKYTESIPFTSQRR